MVALQLGAATRFPGTLFHRQTGMGEQCPPQQEFFDSLKYTSSSRHQWRTKLLLFRKTAIKNTPQLRARYLFGAPSGTRTQDPLIKRNQRATIVNFQNCVNSLFLSFYRKFTFCICCIPCTCYPLSHPLSSCSGVQKVCKNVQSQNQPLKTGIGFLCKAGKPVGFEPKTAAEILPV